MSSDTPELQRAAERFDSLVRQSAKEADFQQLFAECPYILSRTLPLKLEASDIRPLGRPGRSEADFIAFPKSRGITSGYGIIELKRPSARILTEPRKGLIILSSSARTAFAQGVAYRQDLLQRPPLLSQQTLMLGNRAHIFVIMGVSSELAQKLGAELYAKQIAQQLPSGCQLIPYDTLFEAFRETIPPRLSILLPSYEGSSFESLLRHVEAHMLDWHLFDVTEEALEFWEAVQREASASSPIGSVFSSDAFRITRGPHTGQLAQETPAPHELMGTLLRLFRQLSEEASRRAIPTQLDDYIGAAEIVCHRRVDDIPLSRPAIAAVGRAVAECHHHGRSYAFMQPHTAEMSELEGRGLIDLHWVDAGEFSYTVHPFARQLLWIDPRTL